MAGNAFKIDRISRLEEDWNGRYAAERTLFSRLCGLIHVRICNMQRHFPSCSASLCDCPKAWILDISKRQLSPVIRHSQVGTIINSLLSNFDSGSALLSFLRLLSWYSSSSSCSKTSAWIRHSRLFNKLFVQMERAKFTAPYWRKMINCGSQMTTLVYH